MIEPLFVINRWHFRVITKKFKLSLFSYFLKYVHTDQWNTFTLETLRTLMQIKTMYKII